MKKMWSFIKKYKKTSILIVIVIIGGIWYYQSSHKTVATTYIVRPVALGSVRLTVSGTGQVSSSQEIAVNPAVSGTLTSLNVEDGDTVTAGEVLATIDSTTAAFSLKSAQIALAKLQSSDPLTVTSNEDSVQSSQTTLAQSYTDGFNTLTSTYNDLGTVITGLNDLFYGKDASPYFSDATLNQSYGPEAIQDKDAAGLLVDQVKAEYAAFYSAYTATSADATSSIEANLTTENNIANDLSQALKDTSIAVGYVVDNTLKQNRTADMTSDQANLTSWTSTVDQDVTSVGSAIGSIDNNTNNLNQSIATLDEANSGSNPLDIASAELAVQQAQYTYDQYTITAPISGTIGNVTLSVGDTASPSTAIGTIVTKNFISHIALNEVDAAKVAVGQPVNITFNALPNVTATGTVSTVDTVGTVSAGVVSYDVVVAFNSDNPEIKAGMSVNAEIVTTEDDNVIVVPNSAIKTLGNTQYVQVPAAGQTGRAVTQVTNKTIQTSISDDTNTEVTSGLNVGDMIVTKTIAGTTAKLSTNILSSLTGRGAGATGAGRAGGGGFGGAGGGTGGAARTTAAPAAAAK